MNGKQDQLCPVLEGDGWVNWSELATLLTSMPSAVACSSTRLLTGAFS